MVSEDALEYTTMPMTHDSVLILDLVECMKRFRVYFIWTSSPYVGIGACLDFRQRCYIVKSCGAR